MKIIKFGKPDCTPCINVSDFLKAKGVDFEEINPFETTTEEEDLLVLENNIKTIPVTILQKDGETVLRKAGYNEKALEHLIEQYQKDNDE